VFTFTLAGAKSYHAMLGLRFVVGLFEAGYWPALYYILGSWYNKRKLSCRTAGTLILDDANISMDWQASLENAMAFFNLQYLLHRFSVVSCRPGSTIPSMDTLVLLDGDGSLVTPDHSLSCVLSILTYFAFALQSSTA